MKTRLLGCVALVLLLQTTAFADEAPYVPGTWRFTAAEIDYATFETAEAACRGWAKEVAKRGMHREFVDVKATNKGLPGEYHTCVYKDLDATKPTKQVQDNSVQKVLRCPVNARIMFVNGATKLSASQTCQCDAGKLCPRNYCGVKPDPNRAPASAADVKAQSAVQQHHMKNDPDGADLLAAYERQKDLTRADNGRFPTFDPADMFQGRPNDINIGTLCGTRQKDFDAANALAGLKCTPDDHVWHHHQQLGRMQLVKISAHKEEDHAGGVSIWNKAMCDEKDKKNYRPAMCGYKTEGRPKKRPPCPNP